ncbi:MAG TPA: hypothetical protein VE597_02605 [Geminicoccaceae bacterium]|nr:hypothetical protein [Geminicoccaceae bacterium]
MAGPFAMPPLCRTLADGPDQLDIPGDPAQAAEAQALFGLGIRHDHRPVGCKLMLPGLAG